MGVKRSEQPRVGADGYYYFTYNLGVAFNRFGFADSVFIHFKPECFSAYMVDVPDSGSHNGDSVVFLIKTVYKKERGRYSNLKGAL
ncbi:MAG: hypothetical protein IJ514_04650 [Clostridia bacterium]|nr:hypothetical protein [Clostridia bacterium]